MTEQSEAEFAAPVVRKGTAMTPDQWQMIRQQTQALAQDRIAGGGFVPAWIKNSGQIAAVIMAGAEIGLGPMTSLRKISLINGKPSIETEALLGLVKSYYGSRSVKVLETDDKHCKVRFHHPEDDPADDLEIEWTMERANRAKLTSKPGSVWQSYPEMMLRWRAISEGIHVHFPEVTMGLMTREELNDGVELPEVGALANEVFAALPDAEAAPQQPQEDIHDAVFQEVVQKAQPEPSAPSEQEAPAATESQTAATVVPARRKDGVVVDLMTGVTIEDPKLGSLNAYNSAVELYSQHAKCDIQEAYKRTYKGARVNKPKRSDWEPEDYQKQVDWVGAQIKAQPTANESGSPDFF